MRGFRHAGIANLYERDGVFYFRRQLPSKFWPLIGCREFRKSLKTRNRTEASARCYLAGFAFNNALRKIEAMKTLSIEVVPTLARQYLAQQMDEFLTLAEFGARDQSTFDIEREYADALDRETAYRGFAVKRTTSSYIEGAARRIAAKAKYSIDGASEEVTSQLHHSLCRAEAEVMRMYAAALKGNYANATLQDPLFAGFVLDDPLATGVPRQAFCVEDAVESFLRAKSSALAAKSMEDLNRLCQWVLQWFGADTDLHDVGVEEVRGFRDQLACIPANNSKQLEFRKASAAGDKAIGLKTQAKYFSLLRLFFNWLVEEGYLDKSPVGPIKVKGKVSKKSDKRPFRQDELMELLRSPVCRGFMSKHHWSKPGKVMRQTSDFWCLMIGMLSGMRLGEIVTLCKGNVRLEGNVYVFEVNEDTPDKTVKSAAGVRLVPVHPRLLELGLLDWIKLNCKGGNNRPLFPSLISAKKGDPGNKASKRMNRYLEAIGIKKDKTVSFHCFRHAFIDQLRNAKTEEYLIHKIVGHADHSTTALYGEGSNIERCLEAVEQCYAGHDFSVVKVKP